VVLFNQNYSIMKNYNMADAVMFQKSRTKRQHFLNLLAEFIAFDADFDAPFAADWLASIEASEGWETHETRQAQQGQETTDVLEVMQEAREKYNQVMYFVKKAYPNKPEILKEFGVNVYDEAATDQAKMVPFLSNLHKQCTDPAFATDLATANLTPAMISEILTIKNRLNTEDTEQNTFVESTAMATQARHNQFNGSFSFWQRANAASKVIHRNDPVKLNLFLFPRRSETQLSLEGTVTNANGGALLEGVAVTVNGSELTVLTDENGDYAIAGLAAGNYVLQFTLSGFVDVTQQATVATGENTVVNVAMQAA